MTYETTIIKKLNKNFINSWLALWNESASAHAFNSPEWFQLYCRLNTIADFSIICIKDKEFPVVILPLVNEKKLGIPTFQNPGGKYLDRSSLLYKALNKTIINELVHQIKKLGNVYLQEVPEELATLFKTAESKLSVKESSASPYITLKNNPLRYMASDVKNKMVNRINKNMNHLSFNSYAGEIDSLYIAMDIDQRSTKMKQGIATFGNKKEFAFFKTLMETYKKNCIIDIVYFDNTPFVYSIGLTYKKTFHAICTAYDDTYKYLQPGKTLLYFMFHRLQEERKEVFDFSRGINSLKKDFTPHVRKQYDISFTRYPFTDYWWSSHNNLRTFILNNKFMYQTYCSLRKHLTSI